MQVKSWIQDERNGGGVMKWRDIHVFPEYRQRFFWKFIVHLFLLLLWSFPAVIMVLVNCHGADVGCYLPCGWDYNGV
jgi:hypothetical protein